MKYNIQVMLNMISRGFDKELIVTLDRKKKLNFETSYKILRKQEDLSNKEIEYEW